MLELIPFRYRYGFNKLSFPDKLSFIWKSLWFPWRRFLRLLKRCTKQIGKWLLFFIPFSIALALGTCLCLMTNVIEWRELGSVLLSVIFGSFILLVMKDIWDVEAQRHKVLVEQFDIYSEYLSFVGQKYLELLELGNVVLLQDAKYPFENEERFARFKTEMDNQAIVFNDLQKRNKVIDELIEEFIQLKGVLANRNFIDLNDSGLYINIYYTIDDLNQIKTTLDSSNSKYAQDLTSVVLSSYHIFACLRRPWRYPMDAEKRIQLDAWLDLRINYREKNRDSLN